MLRIFRKKFDKNSEILNRIGKNLNAIGKILNRIGKILNGIGKILNGIGKILNAVENFKTGFCQTFFEKFSTYVKLMCFLIMKTNVE